MKNISQGWIGDHGRTGGVFKSQFLCVLIKIGGVPQSLYPTLDRMARAYDGRANQIPEFTCRVWTLMVIKDLVQAGLLQCSDLTALQNECFAIGNSQIEATVSNVEPRPVHASRICRKGPGPSHGGSRSEQRR
jgi:hypothetical protein